MRKALANQVGIKEILFDVINQHMQVRFDPLLIQEETLTTLIRSTGMHASLEKKDPEKKESKPLILCILSGLFLSMGIVAQGSLQSFLSLGLIQEALPLQSILLYASSIIAGGWLIAPRAWTSLKHLTPDMHLLLLIAGIGAIALGQWFEAATVVFLFSLSLLLEQWSVERARKAIQTLLNLTPQKAHVLGSQGELLEKELDQIGIGELLLVKPGERIPLDAIVRSGSSLVNQAPITGESMPVFKGPGETVYAGTLCEDGALQCEVIKRAEETLLAQIIHMVDAAKDRKARSEQWVEKFARIYTPIMLALATTVAVIPPLFGVTWSDSIYRALVLLVIACPCALVISTPVTIVSALTSAAREGVLIKGGIYLESAGHLQAIAFDKTGTITRGHPEVLQLIPLNHHTEEELLLIAATLEQASDHPLARAVVRKAHALGITPSPAHSFQIFRGMGAEGFIGTQRFWIGSHRFMHEKAQETPHVHDLVLALENAGHSVIAIGDFSHVCGLISVADEPRPFVQEMLNALRTLGIQKQVLLTGDHASTARLLAEKVGIQEFYADLLPTEKVAAVTKLAEEYRHIAMVGDGINDAPALAASPLGIAMGGSGSAIASETADIVLMSDDLAQLPRLILHARSALKIVKQNIAFALGIKALFLVLATLGLSSLWMAIAADTGASLLVIFNALRLLSYPQKQF